MPRDPAHRIVGAHQRSSAKRLRRDMTDAERKLWTKLRAHRLQGLSFRRQSPVGPYIVDFVCHAHRLIIEVDGSQHGHPGGQKRDAVRDARLAELGYRTLRFWNSDIFSNLDGVLIAILAATEDAPPSRSLRDSASPSRGEGIPGSEAGERT